MKSLPISISKRTAIDVALEIAGYAGSVLEERFTESKIVTVKGRGNIVTQVDIEVETVVKTMLEREYPNIPVLGEAKQVTLLDSDGRRGFVEFSVDLDSGQAVDAISSLMEGGREAFKIRAAFYAGAN